MKKIAFLVIIALFFFTGCMESGFDAASVAKNNEVVKAFLAQYPQATITASYLDQDDVNSTITDLKDLCGSWMDAEPYWRVLMTDPQTGTKMEAWVKESTSKTVCVTLKQGNIIQQVTNATGTATQVVKPAVTDTSYSYDVNVNESIAEPCYAGKVRVCTVGNCPGIQKCYDSKWGECYLNNPECGQTSVCSNGICEANENAYNCPEDCWKCGDGICSSTEKTGYYYCAQDCKWEWPSNETSKCGNGICEQVENVQICPEDCTKCGDGICSGKETNITCPEDCGPVGGGSGGGNSNSTNVCGNGICETNETIYNCPSDCTSGGSSSNSTTTCGDNICKASETIYNCPQDCV